jgi:large subunit ribosomal protein L13
MPLGRIAKLCAVYMRGKHKPHYDQTKPDLGDTCVIVNAANLLVTGKKMDQKLYRHHTGYAGGLHEYNLRTLIEKEPYRVFYRAIKGMIPKNNIRE